MRHWQIAVLALALPLVVAASEPQVALQTSGRSVTSTALQATVVAQVRLCPQGRGRCGR